ncbi:hypothetical protein H0H87_006925 [Tephrocybe sp. NHM501043]|nr:hypothetical protein H0H87_006925 [Tephrocybe sp. NHM501043]
MGLQEFKQALQSKFDRKKTKTQPISNSDVILPTELWLQILSLLPLDTVATVTLISRSLRWIAQPLLFKEDLAIHPFTISIAYRRLQVDSYLARCHDRLDFLSSPRIAPHIVKFSLTPFPAGHSLSRNSKPHIPENEIVDHVFDVLPLFTGLRSLTIHSIKSTPERMTILRSLALDYFELETRGDDITWQKMRQGVTPPTPIPAQRVLSFNCDTSPHQVPIPALVSLQFLHPTTLNQINAGPNGTESILVAMSLSSSTFPRLHTLDISARYVSCAEFIPTLHQCPNLITLRIRSSFTDSPVRPHMAPLPPQILPSLSTYHGPPYLARFFANNRDIRDFKLWSSRRPSSVVQPAKLVPILQQLGVRIEALEIGVTTLPPFLISVIAENMPALKSLAVNAHLASYHPGVVTTHVAQTPFKPSISIREGSSQLNLDTLSFGVQIPDGVLVGSSEYQEAGLAFLEKFPVQYDPTSWDQWAIELAWSKIIWNRIDLTDRDLAAPGELSIEHVEYHSAVFRTLD